MLKTFYVPENNDFYKECLILRLSYADHPMQLHDEIDRLPELREKIMYGHGYYCIADVKDNPQAMEKLDNRTHYRLSKTEGLGLLSFLGVDVEWFKSDIDRNRCILISEKLYKQFKENGLMDKNTLTFINYSSKGQERVTLPVAGIIRNIPYDSEQKLLVAISPDWEKDREDFILVPKDGKGKSLALRANETVQRLEPEIMNEMVSNFRKYINSESLLVSAVRTGGWILGIISLIICAMSIFSTITLDTRARKKEVAIRKVNGAKKKNIYRMFGRVYLVLIGISLLIVVPACVLLNNVVVTKVLEIAPSSSISPVLPIFLGVAVIFMLIVVIVGWQIHRVMEVDPAKIITKE